MENKYYCQMMEFVEIQQLVLQLVAGLTSLAIGYWINQSSNWLLDLPVQQLVTGLTSPAIGCWINQSSNWLLN